MRAPTLFARHRKLAYAIAGEFYLPGAERQDVEQEALIGLWVATTRWRSDGGASFRTFAALVIRRRLGTLLEQALRNRQRALNESARGVDYDGEWVAIVDTLPGGRDPLDVVVDRERFDRIVAAAGSLTELERESLRRAVNGEPYSAGERTRESKRVANAVDRARAKLRSAA